MRWAQISDPAVSCKRRPQTGSDKASEDGAGNEEVLDSCKGKGSRVAPSSIQELGRALEHTLLKVSRKSQTLTSSLEF